MDLHPNRLVKRFLGPWILLAGLVCLMGTQYCFGFQSPNRMLEQTLTSQVSPLVYDSQSSHRREYQTLGASSCSASACHGGPAAGVSQTQATRGSEYPLWFESDPHAHSWRTLNSKRSVEILERLQILVDGRIANRSAYQNCLACHNTSVELESDGISPVLPEGVGCEACHGPSQAWRDSHYQGPASVDLAIANRGLVDTKSEWIRAKACTLCHVGGPDRDMNHDIIAAGHPALYFDYSTYLKGYPKHWRERPEVNVISSPQRWILSQMAQADSELELMKTRIRSTHSHSTWPEFSNFQCTSCHQEISDTASAYSASYRRQSDLSSLGKAPIRLWNLDGLMAVDQAMGMDPTKTNELLGSIQEASASNSNGTDLDRLSTLIQQKRVELHQKLVESESSNLARFEPHWSIESQRTWAHGKWRAVKDSPNWEQAALAYLATLASDPVSGRSSALERFRQRLIFPEDTQSPIFPDKKTRSSFRNEDSVGLQSNPWSKDISEILQSLHP